ncbi:hemagglutinin repeat-containing protein [Achromobacter ruhlandii]|uniref:two-partner secretion domain-containing protein n=2 Tax=Achromobacter TaxID=222 RepID=UPI0007BEF45B|nr:hemagglutinin repeat-containing protein [Achromobacter ruhlandii]
MMSKLRSLIVWSVVFTQVWSPVLAQTLPISVDKSVPGARPSVGVSHGVPVVNIAPPSAGGVSNNRYTQFNVGPSGVVLNNSGGASQTQLAGQVSGNLMLGNRHAGTILNQVTAPNPSQLLGTLEVAGNRANVIVANPAGITCNGCGFLNADRATLTTGKPRVGPDGGIGFDVTTGRLAVEGQGLNGMNLSQVDLLARTLEINAGIWANRLNVTAGASRVDYGSDAISAQAGDGPAPIVALDTAALGGMYANSIRLIGTEAGVGVNIGGNLAALTGDLQVNAAGDVRIAPRATVQAAGDLRVNSGGTLAVQGAAQATGAVTLAATADVSVPGAVGAGALLSMNAGGDVAVGPLGSLRTQGALRVAAGRDLSMSARLLTSGQDARMQSGRNLTVAGQAAMPPPVQGGAADSGAAAQAGAASVEPSNAPADSRGGVSLEGGLVSAKDGVTLQAGRDLVLPQQVVAAGTLLTEADGNLTLAAGTQLQSAGNVTMRAGHDVSLGGTVLTDAALSLTSGNDLVQGSTGKLQGERVDTSAGRDLALGGTLVSTADVQARATRDTRVDGKLSAGGSLDLDAGRHLSVGAAGQADASGKTRINAPGDLSLAGAMRANQGFAATTGGELRLQGAVDTSTGPLALVASGDLSIGTNGSARAGGSVDLRTGGNFTAAGSISSSQALTIDAMGSAVIDGALLAGEVLSIEAVGKIVAGAGSTQQARGALRIQAGEDLALAGLAQSNAGLTLSSGRDLRVDGGAFAYGGTVSMTAGQTLTQGAASRMQGGDIIARAGSDVDARGEMAARGDIALLSARDLRLSGEAAASGNLDLQAKRNVLADANGIWEANGGATVTAGQDAAWAGALRVNRGIALDAAHRLSVDGLVTTAEGGLLTVAGGELSIGVMGRMISRDRMRVTAGANLLIDGELSSLDELAAQAVCDARVGGKLHAATSLGMAAGGDLVLLRGASAHSDGDMALRASQDLALAGMAAADGGMVLTAARDLGMAGDAFVFGARVRLDAGRNARLEAGSRLQGQDVDARAGGRLRQDGKLVSFGDIRLAASHDLSADGWIVADGKLDLSAHGDARIAEAGRVESASLANLRADGEIAVAGDVRGNGGTAVDAGRTLHVQGLIASARGALAVNAGQDLTVSANGRVLAGGPLKASAGGSLASAGMLSSLADLALEASKNLTLLGQSLAAGDMRLDAGDGFVSAAGAQTQAGGALSAKAGSATLAGNVIAGGVIHLRTDGELRLDGGLLVSESALAMASGGDLMLAASSAVKAGGLLTARAGGALFADGAIQGESAIHLSAVSDAVLNGDMAANGLVNVMAGKDLGDLRVGQGAHLRTAARLSLSAGRDMAIAGALASVEDMTLAAARDARVDGSVASDAGLMLTGRDIAVGDKGLIQAGGTMAGVADRSMVIAGRAVAGHTQSLSAGERLSVAGTVAALQGDLSLAAMHGDAVLGAASRQEAGDSLMLSAGGVLQVSGTSSAGQDLSLHAGTDALLDGVIATRRGALMATAMHDLRIALSGRLQSGGGLALAAGDALTHAGVAVAGARVDLSANTALVNTGSVLAAGDLSVRASGMLHNSGRLVAGVDADGGLNLPGSLEAIAGKIQHPGVSLAGKDMRLSANGLQLDAGALSTAGQMTLASTADIDTAAASLHAGALDLSAVHLRNQNGALTAEGEARVKLSASLDNTHGTLAAAGQASVDAASIDNRDGTLAGGDLAIATPGAVDNRNGLILADGVLSLSAANLDNRAPTGRAAAALGVLGRVADILVEGVNNRGGAISAIASLALKARDLDNTAGRIASQGDASIEADVLKNGQGELLAGQSLSVRVKTLQALGTLRAGDDLSLDYAGSLNHEGDITAGRDLKLTLGGALDNQARISAGRDLGIRAESFVNHETGEWIAGGANTIGVTHGVVNEGLIDGTTTRIAASSVDNLGRIYGGQVSISAGTLVNTAGTKGPAVIASRADMDLGAGSVVNEKGALVYSAADLRMGGALDAAGTATGQAALVRNSAAMIEAAGEAKIAATLIQNLNPAYASRTEQVSSEPKFYFRQVNQDQQEFGPLMDGSKFFWVCHEYRGICSQNPAQGVGKQNWLLLLPPSEKYPASRYGPPFDYGVPNWYGDWGRDPTATTWPIAPSYTPADPGCAGMGDDDCDIPRDLFAYASDARIWSVFGVTPPDGPMPEWSEPEPAGCAKGKSSACDAYAARRSAYEQAYAAYKARHLELDAGIKAFNRDVNSRWQHAFMYYRVNETVVETRTVSSDPGQILSGAAMTLTGSVTNDKSRIAAGGALTVVGPAINNIGASGTRTVTREGVMTLSFEKQRHARKSTRWESSRPYTSTLAAEAIEVPVATATGAGTVTLSGAMLDATSIGAPQPVRVQSVDLPGGTAVRSVSNPAGLPDSQLFVVDTQPQAPFLVATDPRFAAEDSHVSSDYLLELLRQPGASPGISAGGIADDVDPAAGSAAESAPARLNINAGAQSQVGSVAPGIPVVAGDPVTEAHPGGWYDLIPPGAKFLTPAGQPRRLGDGFHEQKVVSDQILATSGQRFLENYANQDAQYKALLAAGAWFARTHGVKLGARLTEAQQRLMTTDLVWLIEQPVTLADGSVRSVLVPQVYLLVRKDDLKGDGTLIAGRDVDVAAEDAFANSGTVAARQAMVVRAGNIVNQADGTLQARSVDLAAREDLTNLVSLIKGDKVGLSAGRDIALTSTSASERASNTWGTYLTGIARIDAGSLDARAGRDLSLIAAQITARDDERLQAGRDLNMTTLTERKGERIERDPRNRYELNTSREIGAMVAAGGNLTMTAGRDVNARAGDVTAGKDLAVAAGRDINAAAGVQTQYSYIESYSKQRGFLSSRSNHMVNAITTERALATTFTGDTAVLMAGRDVAVTGSNLGAQHDLTVSGARDVKIAAGANSMDIRHYERDKQSGLGAMGGLSYGTRRQTDSLDGKNVFHTASTVGSVEGDTLIRAERALNVTGSNVLARQGDVTLTGRGINIAAALDTTRDKELHEVKQSGASINASAPLISAMQTAGRMNEAAGKTDNKVMQGLALATTGLAALNAYDAMMADPKSAGGVSLSIDLGTSKSQSATDRASSSTAGSTVAAGQDLTLLAQGAGSASDITLTGSRLSAGGNALLEADGNIQLRAAQNTFEQNTKNKSSSASVGIGVSADSENGAGVMVTIGVSGARGRADGKDTRWTYADVSAGNVLALRSGADTSLIGATGRADRITASVGKDLRLETLQDASTYDAKQQSIGVKANICVYGYCKSSVSGHVAQGRMNSDFRSASEQAGLKAGDGGFQLDIARNTTLIGAAVSSSERAALEGRNALGTGTLDVQDVKNTARYKADQIALSGGYSWGGDGGGAPKKGDAGKADVAANANGQAAGGADKARESGDKGGASAGLPVVAGASGKASSTTRSAISGGNVVIRDEVAQQDLTGLTATQTIAALNRDTSSDTLNALKPIFDKEKIEAGFEIASEVNRQVGQFLETRARQAKALEDALKNEPEGPRRDQLRAQHEAVQKWGPGGRYREALMAVSLATGANVTGSASGFVQAATVNYLQSLSAAKIKEIAPLLGGEGSAGHVALHALLGCAGAAAKSTGCGAAATGASAGIVISQLMEQVSGKSSNKLDPVKREARINLVTSVLAGLTAALDPKAVAAVNDAARVELENNQLALPLPVIGAGSAGGAFGSLGRRDSNGVASANENIARHLTRVWNRLFEKDSGPEEANGPLETPAVPPGGDTRVPGYAEDGRHAQSTPGYEADQGSLGTPSYNADGNAYLGGSVTPMPEQQGPQVILNEAKNKPDFLGKTASSPALPDSPYSPSNVDVRIRPPYQANEAHNKWSSYYNPAKTPEPADAQSAYEAGAVRGGMGTWYAQGRNGYYRYSSDNAGTVHFSGTMTKYELPNSVLKELRK